MRISSHLDLSLSVLPQINLLTRSDNAAPISISLPQYPRDNESSLPITYRHLLTKQANHQTYQKGHPKAYSVSATGPVGEYGPHGRANHLGEPLLCLALAARFCGDLLSSGAFLVLVLEKGLLVRLSL